LPAYEHRDLPTERDVLDSRFAFDCFAIDAQGVTNVISD